MAEQKENRFSGMTPEEIRLEAKRHPVIPLYETFLQPTDDMHNYVYLTYDNALVCCAMRALATLLERPELEQAAQRTRQAVYAHCVKEQDGRPFFCLVGGFERPL